MRQQELKIKCYIIVPSIKNIYKLHSMGNQPLNIGQVGSWQASLTHATGSLEEKTSWKVDTRALNQTIGQKPNQVILPNLNQTFKMNDIWIMDLNQ